jgi:MFS superfamily sulfate permease-like transporter
MASLVDLGELRRIAGVRRRDLGLAFVALAGVLLFGVLNGVLLAVVTSFLVLLYVAGRPPISVLGRRPGTTQWRPLVQHPNDETVPGLLVVRPEAALYFANVKRITAQINALAQGGAQPPRVVLIDASAVPDLEVTALDAIDELATQLRSEGIDLWIASLNERPLKMLRAAHHDGAGNGRLFSAVEEAASAMTARAPV